MNRLPDPVWPWSWSGIPGSEYGGTDSLSQARRGYWRLAHVLCVRIALLCGFHIIIIC